MPTERFLLNGAEILVGADVEETVRIAAGQFTAAARKLAAEKGSFQVALSGGSTPRKLFETLGAEPFRGLVPWHAVHVYWGDERDVAPGDAQSNYGVARELLLSRVPVPAAQVHRIPAGNTTAVEAAELYQRTLRDRLPLLRDLPRLDYVLLGLGTNGHTASLFPHCPALHEQSRLVTADHVEEVGGWRITLTAGVLNNAGQITFLATGADKAAVVQLVLCGERDTEQTPAQLIAPRQGQLTWILDATAAEKLPRG
ncbi:MAG: 6-phosphogluconolactonase [Acidobacteriota bacterium]|nr:6-phosphogluconolactonase [Acidobacteriota bacterium]